jgi:hypothetical protein
MALMCVMLIGCAAPTVFPPSAPATGKRPQPTERNFRASDIAKADIDIAAETHAQECLASARLLMEKLYRRNPREWRKGNYSSMQAAVDRAFNPQMQFRFPELGNAQGAEAISLALKVEYSGDRIFAFGVGLASMIFISYNSKAEFYLTDTLDPQRLYNSARNIEIAAWKLANARDDRGSLLILSNDASGDVANLSFEREIGKIIGYQDVMAQIAAQRTNRTIRRAVQSLAVAVFLPM